MPKFIVARVKVVKTVEFCEVEAKDPWEAVEAEGKFINSEHIISKTEVPFAGVICVDKGSGHNPKEWMKDITRQEQMR